MSADRANRTVLVTGGAGYIGSHACMALAAAGWHPVTYDDLSNGHRWAVQWGPLEVGDIRDRSRLAEVMTRHRPRAVLHFAGLIEAGESVRNPTPFYDVNVGGTVALIEAMQAAAVSVLVFSSTAAVYGMLEQVPAPEEHPRRPINPYGHSKAMVEQVLSDVAATGRLTWTALRYFNAAGADPEARIGECHSPETHLIPLVLEVAHGSRSHVQIFGTDYDTPDGTCIRDFVHVTDLAGAHVAALHRMLGGGDSTVVNLGSGCGWTVRQVIEAARRVTGATIAVNESPRRPGDPAALVSDSQRAAQILGWRPAHADLEGIVRDAWRWYRKLAQQRALE